MSQNIARANQEYARESAELAKRIYAPVIADMIKTAKESGWLNNGNGINFGPSNQFSFDEKNYFYKGKEITLEEVIEKYPFFRQQEGSSTDNPGEIWCRVARDISASLTTKL